MIRVVVCGSNYGKYYAWALRRAEGRYRLEGILARGSDRSAQLARRNECRLFLRHEDLPKKIDLACVAVGAAGESVIFRLLDQGVSVLCEHPIGSESLKAGLDSAAKNKVRFHVNAHFPNLPEVKAFIQDFRRRTAEGPPRQIDIVMSDRALYAVAAILAEATLDDAPRLSLEGDSPGTPFTLVGGRLGDTQVSLAVQRTGGQVDPDLADGSPEILSDFNLRAIFSTGVLTLHSPAGPVVWTANGNRMEEGAMSMWSIVGSPVAPTPRDFFDQRIDANLRSIDRLALEAFSGTRPPHQDQDHLLRVSLMWEEFARAITSPS